MSAINSLCRTCMINIIDNTNTDEDFDYYNIFETENLVAKLSLCSNIEIQPFDEYPPNVCNTCCIHILDFCDFQEMCRESMAKFDKMLEKHNENTETSNANMLQQNASQQFSADNVSNPNNKTTNEESSNHCIILDDNAASYMTPATPHYDVVVDTSESNASSSDAGPPDLSSLEHAVIGNVISCDHDYIRFENYPETCSNQADANESYIEQDNCKIAANIKRLGVNSSTEETLNTLQNKRDSNRTANDASRTKDITMTAEKLIALSNETKEDVYIFQDVITYEEPVLDIVDIAEGVLNPSAIHTSQSLNNAIKADYDDGDLERTLQEESSKSHDNDVTQSHDSTGKQSFPHNDFRHFAKGQHENLSNVTTSNEERLAYAKKDKEDEYEDYSSDEDFKGFSENGTNEEIFADSAANATSRKLKSNISFFCDLCPQTFILEDRLLAHKRAHQGLPGYPCTRINCSRSFWRLSELRQHLNDHDGIPRPTFKCDRSNCEQKFTAKCSLLTHVRKHHSFGEPPVSPTNFVCETCGKSIKNAHKFRIHQYLHVDESLWPFKCDVEACSKMFRSKENYKIHKNRHDGIKPYACTYCDKTFCATTNLKAHLNYHTMAKQWPCNFCSKICYTAGQLKHHIRQKHEENPEASHYPCRFCNKVFGSHTGRNAHQRKHTGEKPYKCEECGRKFTHRTSYIGHKQTHIPEDKREKKFGCDYCNRAFYTAVSLREHKMSHTGEKPFECERCGGKFRYQSNILRHIKLNICKRKNSSSTADKIKNRCNDVSQDGDNIPAY